jgi:cell division initiation protein
VKVTPLELKKADFKRGLRGYDPDEVHELLASAAETLEEAVRENKELREKITQLQERLRNYESMEKTINETMLMAQRASDSVRQAADRESELILAKAEVEADKLLEEARDRLKELKRDMEMLGHERHAFLLKMRSLVASQWKLLQEETIGEPVRRTVVENRSPDKSSPVQTRANKSSPAAPTDFTELKNRSAEAEAESQKEEVEDERLKDLSGHLAKVLKSQPEPDKPSALSSPEKGGEAAELVWEEGTEKEPGPEVERNSEEEGTDDFFGSDEEDERKQ